MNLNKMLYRSLHRGCKETDILLGDFAIKLLNSLNEEELKVYEQLLEENDWDIYNWILNEEENLTPLHYTQIISKIRDFNVNK